ncbi:BlaI/MecI/CopY family transcriptional regulator [Candidatus Woesearchaeota archaeon]|nr:BlaI/MecI/CopY family transcriptional regulator [Candidatus Woesearchaeota archaeon]
MNESELLIELGFTPSEAKIYLALVEQGPATIGELVKRTRIHTSVLYTAVQRLVQRGLITYVKKGRTKTFSAADPKSLLQRTQNLAEELHKVIPAWEQRLKVIAPEIIVEVYEGFPGLTNMFNALFADAKSGDEYFSFTLGQEFQNEECLKWFNNLGRRRMALKLNVKALCPLRFKALFERVGDPKILAKTGLRFSKFEFPQGIIIFHDSIIFISCDPTAKAIRIKDANLAEQYRTFFMQLYASGTSYVPPRA